VVVVVVVAVGTTAVTLKIQCTTACRLLLVLRGHLVTAKVEVCLVADSR
jgi:hypothetical protein